MSKPCIVRPSDQEAVDRGAGLESYPLLGARTGAQGFSNGITVFEPGAAVPLHTHNVEESITMLEGEAVCEVDGKQYTVRPYDTVYAPAGVVHCFRNESGEMMRFLWCYGGTRVTRTFLATGETVAHLSEEDRLSMSDE